MGVEVRGMVVLRDIGLAMWVVGGVLGELPSSAFSGVLFCGW